jgi:hypothetical protein
MWENPCQLYMWQGLITRIYRELENQNSPKFNEEMGKRAEESFLKGRSPNG